MREDWDFRHLHDFNVVFLGKQGWRLITQPDCLMATSIKASLSVRSEDAIQLEDWLTFVFVSLAKEIRGELVAICWSPWCRHNKLIWNKRRFNDM
ncbi:Fe(II) trafficking protein YggX protein [Dioscorea alata]|uniref:Fe(II) trafficking protein YggX protein n=1 Tax=Dioscorea alata TaxID=55571 RepID=A0ACB7UYB0_DIOAL|nr:Fe(II) trafficking protein YggX protein [Dioscorea alata]